MLHLEDKILWRKLIRIIFLIIIETYRRMWKLGGYKYDQPINLRHWSISITKLKTSILASLNHSKNYKTIISFYEGILINTNRKLQIFFNALFLKKNVFSPTWTFFVILNSRLCLRNSGYPVLPIWFTNFRSRVLRPNY